MRKILLISVLLFTACSSTRLVTDWKNPDIVLFDANKVLIIGMTPNQDVRVKFETELQNKFTEYKIESFRSFDLFDVEFTSSEKTEKELSKVEQQLLDKDFDAILLTKILGVEDRQSFRKKIYELNRFMTSFKDDYLSHQTIYYEDDYYKRFKVYQAETSLYCICVGKERELIWQGRIDVTDPVNIEKSVDDYIKLIVVALKEQDIIFRKPLEYESTSL